MGTIFSAIGGAIEMIIGAIASILMTIVSVIVTILVTIVDIILDIICCNFFLPARRSSMRTGSHRFNWGSRRGGATAAY